MSKMRLLMMFFVVAIVSAATGFLIGETQITNGWKMVGFYFLACVCAYSLYCISGESKREELDKWEDE
ncbi:hypothetical protein [Vibrio cholerae]|uniref:hypothetical protein n=1 Tax=Vibrio cholerae TaxID=666 RepID=UPI002FE56869